MLADLSAEFHWPPDTWRTMGWRAFRAWVLELARRRREEALAQQRAQQQQQHKAEARDWFAQHGAPPPPGLR